MQISVTGTDTGFESTASESKSLSLGGRLVTVHRPESRRLILQLLTSSKDLSAMQAKFCRKFS